ncbi:MAG: exodeoxyribonuclease V subunit alpha [Rhodanobacter sp.]|jgi:exodeoxyribonuclease V alpha subunit|nr:exodeoxyribonuclease V subunit alpha [Rhodanobacter sp.]
MKAPVSLYSSERKAEPAAPAIWRALDHALAHWVRVHGGSSLLANVAAWASFADGMGDAALPLRGEEAGRHGMPPLSAAMLDALRRESLVGDGSVVTPFVLDADGRFALWRHHADEVAVAQMIRARRAAALPNPSTSWRDDLDVLFAGSDAQAVARQREAVAGVLGRRLFVLTGGPGTGKTTTVLRMLLMLQRHSARALTIRVAAPTAKAAQRLVQSLREGKERLAADALVAPAWQVLLARIPDTDAATVHRLLDFDPYRNVFRRGGCYPLAADVVVVDEASMIDLGMLRALLDATPLDAALILVGDADQLTSVATGSVLMDIVAAFEREGAPEWVRLDHDFRAQRQLVPIHRAVHTGDARVLADAFAAAPAHAVWRRVDTPARLREHVLRWAGDIARLDLRPLLPAQAATPDGETLARSDAEHARSALALQALRTLAQRQLLCALREEAFGALAVDALIERELKRLWHIAPETVWYAGRAVIITRNDPASRLFNGDVGIALADASGVLQVWFATMRADGRIAAHGFAPAMLPPHEGAFAITIHKSQGSEYARTAVLLPPEATNRVLSRPLLYTGLSRSRQDVELWASDAALRAALERPIRRAGGLIARLCDGSRGESRA